MNEALTLFVEFLANFILWLIIGYFVLKIIMKKKISFRTLIIILLISIIATYPTYEIIKSNNSTQETSQTSTSNASLMSSMSMTDENRIKDIITKVMQNADYLTPEIHSEFWAIIQKHGKVSTEDVNRVRDMMTGVTTKYMHYFYEDALISLKTGKAYKSKDRGEYEKYLLSIGLTESRITTNDIMMENIALKKPIAYQDSSIIFTEEIIKGSLDNIDAVTKRIDILFTKP